MKRVEPAFIRQCRYRLQLQGDDMVGAGHQQAVGLPIDEAEQDQHEQRKCDSRDRSGAEG
ncbi:MULTISPECIES: hypothetical protein [unclassified Tardiphaga]|uniref:hypothetical protein n=1 Tax=unclassified Tardiphaga TaxID=2631404 RepID=UPI0013146DFD